MTNYYILAVNSLIKTFSVLDAGNTVNFCLTTQDSNGLFANIKSGDKILGYVGVPINRVKYVFEVQSVDSSNQIELIKKYEVADGALINNMELERELSVTEIVKIDNNTFFQICKELLDNWLTDGDEEETIEEKRDLELERLSTGVNVLLYGVPGSGKSWTIEHEYCKPGTVVERLVFHPDYTNADFIGQILPVVDPVDKMVTYEFTPGPFTNILKEAYNDPSKPYVLIIEEINRGNAPAIFGDVFQLLDRTVDTKVMDGIKYPKGTSEYGITSENIAKVVYEDGKHKVRIPSNLSILGTMNTSDQNVFTLDTAFQRRWNMRLIENNFNNVRRSLSDAEILDTKVTWQKFCETVNTIIIGNRAKMASAEDKRLGVYFVHEQDLIFDSKALPTGDFMTTFDELNDLVRHELLGTLDATKKARLEEMRDAILHNRLFPEKVIKYLWDDAFKFNPEAIFDTENMDSLEKVIRTFVYNKGADRFKIFKQNVRDTLYPTQQ
ncbi:McrB family protein [Lachnospiraceae bacterium SGI.240]